MKSILFYYVIVAGILTPIFLEANADFEISKINCEILLKDSTKTESNIKQDQSQNTTRLEDFIGDWKVMVITGQPGATNLHYVKAATIKMIDNNIITSTFPISRGFETDSVEITLAYNPAERDYTLTIIMESSLTVEGISLTYSEETGYIGELDAMLDEEKVVFGATIEFEENKHKWNVYMKDSNGEKTFNNFLNFSEP
jgi:hypothetical protein